MSRRSKKPLTVEQILAWADEHHERTGRWPSRNCGAIPGTANEMWHCVEGALYGGCRGFRGGSSIAKLLQRHRGGSARKHKKLTIKQILAWADEHYERTGRWPSEDSGPIPSTDAESWSKVQAALYKGTRVLAGQTSLPKLLQRYRV